MHRRHVLENSGARATQTTLDTSSPLFANDDRGLRVLVFGEEQQVAARLPASGRLTIGRGPTADLQIDNVTISRVHAALHVTQLAEGTVLEIEDLGSSNGTVVRGKKLAPLERAQIYPAELVDLGVTTMIVQRAPRPLAPPHVLEKTRSRGEERAEDVLFDARPPMSELYRLLERVAASEILVMLLGETGVGKDVIASAIHARSRRKNGEMLRLNCACMGETLVESELFGHEKGAFTGAEESKPGLLEMADGGTVFLDEVGDLSAATQAKLLRVLEEKQVRRLGGLKSRAIDVRFISATNRELEEAIARGTFRSDLYFRLNGISFLIPPLRERRHEIGPLALLFARRAQKRDGFRGEATISGAAMELLHLYSWPGNIRELKNVIERSVVLAGGDPIEVEHLGSFSRMPSVVEDVEKKRIEEALIEAGGNQSRAAKILGIARGTLLTRLDAYGISRPRKRR